MKCPIADWARVRGSQDLHPIRGGMNAYLASEGVRTHSLCVSALQPRRQQPISAVTSAHADEKSQTAPRIRAPLLPVSPPPYITTTTPAESHTIHIPHPAITLVRCDLIEVLLA